MNPEIFIAGTPDDLAREAARRFAEAAGSASAERGRFAVALSGGTGPRKLFELLAQPPYAKAVDWGRVHVFFADERYVPHDHPDSNLLLAWGSLLDHVPIPREQVHPMPTAAASPESAADAYAETLREFFGGGEPRLDLILLGMGPDGHTASLFPGKPDYPGWVAAVHDSPKPPPTRLTLSLDFINQARLVVFLVGGADKAERVREILGPDGASPLPAARVRAASGETVWLLDRAAGAGLAG